MKYLLLFFFGLAVWWWWRKQNQTGRDDDRRPRARAEERMVTCAHCGVHLPLSESLPAGTRHFCCEGHRHLGPR